MKVAYFSMEFAVDDRLPIYAGGLGVLAGDHLKSSSDLQLPLVAVGLLYREGYFTQVIDENGRQREEYPRPISPAWDWSRRTSRSRSSLADESVPADVWRLDVGQVPLYLLESEALVPRLYTIDREERIRQEVVIGVGGIRALAGARALPDRFPPQRGARSVRRARAHARFEEQGIADEALERVRTTTVFTTHTPVPEGNEVFEPELAASTWAGSSSRCGLEWDDFIDWLGRTPRVGLTPLALRTAAYANGVSELHGEVSRRMWRSLPDPVTRCRSDVTNGAHVGTWMTPDGHAPRARGAPTAAGRRAWERAGSSTELLWSHHYERKRELFALVRERTGRVLDPELLTLGFARRFAPYKRATLLFSDPDRLAKLPVQVLISGKAHPADDPGKELIAGIGGRARPPVRGQDRVRPQLQHGGRRRAHAGVDVWLNTPERPMEASGTSGMKAGMNGVLNLSVLDGWWPEAYYPEIGWAIPGESDEADAAELYQLLEKEVLPAYADRERWVEMMTASIAVVRRASRATGWWRVRGALYEPALCGAPVSSMRLLRELPGGRSIEAFGSAGASVTGLSRDVRQVVVIRIGAGGHLGRHPAGCEQLFLVTEGAGWVTGQDGERAPIASRRAGVGRGRGGHESGTDENMTALRGSRVFDE